MSRSKTGILTNMKIRLAWIAAAVVMASLLILSVNRKAKSGVTQVQIEIEQLSGKRNLVDKKDVLKAFRNHLGFDIEMASIQELKIVELEELLQKDNRVEEAEVYIDSKNRIHVQLKQREPIVRVHAESGKRYYLDKDGNKVPLKKKSAIRVPIASGSIGDYQDGFLEAKQRSALQDVFELMTKVKEDPFLDALVEQIFVEKDGEITLIPKLGREKIKFGAFEDVEEKFYKLKVFYKEGLPREGWDKFASLDLRYRNQVKLTEL